MAARTWRERLLAWTVEQSPDGRQLWWNWAVVLRTSGRVIGYVQATVAGGDAVIAYMIGTQWQQRRHATEAVGALVDYLIQVHAANRVKAWIAPGHTASELVAKAIGLSPTCRFDDDGERMWSMDAS